MRKDFPWLTDDSIDWKAWSYISNPDYKSTNRLIDFWVDVVSKNGLVLLNIIPEANGEIPKEKVVVTNGEVARRKWRSRI